MSRKILVAVTGSTPQILTETIYALFKERAWVPDEVHVLTTTHGRDEIQQKLFEEGQFQKLCDSYDLQGIEFSSKSIHVITNEEGALLGDIKSVEDNDRAANMIVHFIHDLCQNPHNELHVSLAGGRKSMGFYIGYALSLFGRQQDSMSHVLVNHPYEHARDFFFPTVCTQEVTAEYWDKGEKQVKIVDAKDAQIWLSDIPFVRMGEGVPNLNLSTGWEYRDAVALAQRAISDYTVEVLLKERKLICNDRVEVGLTPQQIAFYAVIAKATQENRVITAYPEKYENAYSLVEFAENYLYFYGQTGKDVEDMSVEELLKDIQGEREIFMKLSPVSSKIEGQLNDKLGSISEYFSIQGYGEKLQKYYQIALHPKNIKIETKQ
ncbi:TIGR02584 family CRISPR-associated protein [Ignatzschineria ureiclastica]|uniref:TIGR02584 family CRISPR-associated protein n=1 Tax=Ignatzschineria ureiclastica TaxID=472582 RepID=A0A2U2AEZ1_9GAMM|nr:CRISPR-associated ring nuclease Csm6 [Ignatzschineria ureiclastica]PWD81232.1 TIGR02584 family CRISPR-associated protein [Ignatzschineria ureiclastica]GGZ97330.1 CRISPR-associated protein [Ignatzschineria ureiclastica]